MQLIPDELRRAILKLYSQKKGQTDEERFMRSCSFRLVTGLGLSPKASWKGDNYVFRICRRRLIMNGANLPSMP